MRVHAECLFTTKGGATAIPLQDLGVVQLLAQPSAVELAEAPTRRKGMIGLSLDFFEQTYCNNYLLVAQVRAALRTSHCNFLWAERGITNQLSQLHRDGGQSDV